MKPYVQYKDSGVEWIGEIPEGWDLKKIKHVTEDKGLVRGPFGGSLKVDSFVESGYKVYEQKNAIYKSKHLGSSYISQSKYHELIRFSIKPHDFIMSCSGTIGKSHLIRGDYEEGIINQALLIIRLDTSRGIYHSFMSILMDSWGFQKQIIDNSQGGAMKNLVGIDIFKNIKISLPPLPEQQHIVTYLDQKTTQIDGLIDKKTRKIELLKEYRTSLINQVVTKGLDPNVEMKDSGVEWIGEIPVGWKTLNFHYYIKLRHGYQFRDFDFTESGIRIVKITQLHRDGYLDISNCSFIDSTRLDSFTDIVIKDNDILMCLTGGTIGKIIRVGQVKEPLLQNYRVGHFSSNNSNKITHEYVYWIMNSSVVRSQIFYHIRETGQPNIGMEDFSKMKICLPPWKEQSMISDYLDQKTQEIDQSIETEEKKIEHLKEYRQSLISNVVTGKIDVRDTVLS